MVELFERDVRTNDRQSSKGNQLKWENNKIWYKADYMGYEGLAEYIVSQLLKKSSLAPEEYVLYELEQMRYKTNVFNGVRSKSFLYDDWQIISLERLFRNFFGESLHQALLRMKGCEDKLYFLVNQVERITGLAEFGKYMNKLFTIDAIFLNEDRHTGNISVLMNGEGKFAYCPVFDNGACLLADTTMDYPLGKEVHKLMGEVEAKTLDANFLRQLAASESLYGRNLEFHFTRQEVRNTLEWVDMYLPEIIDRVETVIYLQMRKLQYLFTK